MANRLSVSVVSPQHKVYEGEADMVVAPAWDGQVGILPGHAPMIVLLGQGELRVKAGPSEQRFDIEGGFLQVVGDHVSVLSESAS